MNRGEQNISIKGERTMSRGFVAQYAAEAARQVDGVCDLAGGLVMTLKDAIVGKQDSNGVTVSFSTDNPELVSINIYPVAYFGYVLPDIAWNIQEEVKKAVEDFTGLVVKAVNVEVVAVVKKGVEA